MADLDPRPRQWPAPVLSGAPFNPGEHIRSRFEKTTDYYPTVIISIEDDGITVRFVHTDTFSKVPLDSARRLGPDGEYADGSANFGGSSSGAAARPKKRANSSSGLCDWSLNNVTKVYVQPSNGTGSSVVSRTTDGRLRNQHPFKSRWCLGSSGTAGNQPDCCSGGRGGA